MRWRYKKPQDWAEWHPWFAWHPVHTDTQWVWLERAERVSMLHARAKGIPYYQVIDAPFIREWCYRIPRANNAQS